MSGGSHDYAYACVERFAAQLRRENSDDVLRLAFAAHLERVSRVMHAIEWVDSGDFSRGDEVQPLRELLGPVAAVEQVLKQGEALRAALNDALSARYK